MPTMPGDPPATTTPAAFKTWAQNSKDTLVDHEDRLDTVETDLGTVQTDLAAVEAGYTATGEQVAPDFKATGKTGATASPAILAGGTTTGAAPTTGAHVVGELVVGHDGKLWVCTTAGTPGTWTQVASASSGHTVVRKTADETVNNSATLQNDDHLLFAIGSNEVWVVMFHLFVSAASATPDIKIALSLPSGATSAMGIIGQATGTTGTEADAKIQSFTSATTALSVGVPADSTSNTFVLYSAHIANGSTAGNVQLQWAQSTANASDSKIRTGSFLVADRVA